VKILDFGLAKLSRATSAVNLNEKTATLGSPITVEGSIIGTVSYMSPEQAEGKVVDARSDIFSFGVVVYEMLTGKRAFTGDTTLSTLSSILRDEVRPVSETAANVPPLLDQIIKQCLCKNPMARWQSMQEVRTVLVALQNKQAAPMLGVAQPPAAAKKRAPWVMPLAAAAAVLIVGGAFGLWMMNRNPQSAAPPPAVATAPTPEPPATPVLGKVLDNDGVIAMITNGVDKSVILDQIKSTKTQFDLSNQEIIRLSQAHVPPEIIEAMRAPKPSSTKSAALPTAGTAQTAAATSSAPAPGATPAPPVTIPNPSTPSVPSAEEKAGPSPTVPVAVHDGLPFTIRLSEDIPANAPAGRAIRFVMPEDFRVGPNTVVSKNTVVTGEIVDGGKKKTFRLQDVPLADGAKLSIKAGGANKDGGRPFDGPTMAPHAKDVAAPAGTDYVAYTKGEQTVAVRK
jgi:serine/threonine-protein kinase